MRRTSIHLYGYSRDHKGKIVNYHRVKLSGTIHTSSGGSGNTAQIVAVIYETL